MVVNHLIPDNSSMDRRFALLRHDADELHYDLVIAVGDTLASWRLDGAPSLDPQERLTAVRLADRPLAYLNFDGLALGLDCGEGPLRSVEQGRLHNHSCDRRGRPVGFVAAVDAGEVRIWLEGQWLQGGWNLVRAGERSEWELVKVGDLVARARAAVAADTIG
jgi:DNA ligase D-like protein (predicted 3'-phosphoesterase)